MAIEIANPFVDPTEASRYQRYRPAYHDIPFGKMRELIGTDIDRALDVACGTGHSTAALAKISREAVGCDPSPAMLAEARSGSNLEFVEAFAENLPFEAGTFSLVNISMGIHWVDHERFLAETRKILRPRGYLSIDNYGFSGKIRPDNGFEEFNKRFWSENFPPARRGRDYVDDEVMSSCGFMLLREIPYAHDVRMSLTHFVNFLLTQSNVLIKNTGKTEDLGPRLADAYGRYFGRDERDLRFEGLLKLYQST